MKRRQYLATVGAATAGAGLFGERVRAAGSGGDALGRLNFYSTTALLAADGSPLDDGSLVPVWAPSSASISDTDGNGDAVTYPSGTDVPLVAVDGSVVGLGAMFATNSDDFDAGNEEFLLNVWDDVFGSGTVLWDEGHGQYYTLSKFSRFESYAEDNGYTVESTTSLVGDLDGASGVVVTTPGTALTESDGSALADFVANGGGVVLHSQADYGSHDATGEFNALCDALGVGFHFDDCEVTVGGDYSFDTSNFNASDFASYFAQRPGLGAPTLSKGERYDVDVVSVADGDTVDVRFDNGAVETVRLLGVDTPELPSHASAERGVEWPGLAYDSEPTVDSVTFHSSSSLLVGEEHGSRRHGHGHGRHPRDGSRGPTRSARPTVAAWAEDSATLVDADGNGDATTGSDASDETGRIPLVAVEGSVVAFSAMLVDDGANFDDDTDEFVLNLWDDQLGGAGDVLWATGHDEYYAPERFGQFVDYVEQIGYSVTGSDDLAGDLGGGDADAVVLTTPGSSVPERDRRALVEFVTAGGSVFLHDQSDYGGHDGTAELNAVADALDLGFRFNDAELQDAEHNAGTVYTPTTRKLNADLPVTEDRPGVDGDLSTTYPYLGKWGDEAGAFAKGELSGKSVTLTLDENEPTRGDYGRVLGYLHYDATGDGVRNAFYNLELLTHGLARVYDSGLSKHDEFSAAAVAARKVGKGLWAESDISKAPPFRDRPVTEVYVPKAVEVTRAHGKLGGPHAPVRAADTASTPGAPLVGLDPRANLALVGGLLPDESYEVWEGADTSVSGFEDFRLLAALVDALAGRDTASGVTLVDGGHGQAEASFALSAEDTAYYQRYLEGVGGELRGVNTFSNDTLGDADTLVITPATNDFAAGEVDAVRAFARDGGAVLLLGSSSASDAARKRLNDLADALGSEFRFGDAVTDAETNLDGDETVPRTTAIGPAFRVRRRGRGRGRGRDRERSPARQKRTRRSSN